MISQFPSSQGTVVTTSGKTNQQGHRIHRRHRHWTKHQNTFSTLTQHAKHGSMVCLFKPVSCNSYLFVSEF